MYKSNKIKNIPTSNINESQVNTITLIPSDSIDDSNIIENEYINNYYKNCNKLLKVSDLFSKYVKCIDIHQITSSEEFEFYKDLDYIPLTKKYYYTLNSINAITDNTTYYTINVTLDVYNLLYDNYLKNTLYSNIYLENSSYINKLQYNTSINLNIIFDSNYFYSYNDCTIFVNSNDFSTKLSGHLNCILFNDIVVYFKIKNNISLNIISDIEFSNKFILNIDTNFYIEGELDSISYSLTNTLNDTTINTQELDICYIPFYKNIIFIKTFDVDNLSIIFNMIFLNNFIPVNNDTIEFNNLKLGNDYLFKSYKYFSSNKFLNKFNFDTAKNYTNFLFNNLYYINTIEKNDIGVINVYSIINNNHIIVQTYPFTSLKEKYKIVAVLEHNTNIHNINEYIDNENIIINYDFTSINKFENIDILNEQDYIDINSKNININTVNKLNEFENNGNIFHTESVTNDYEPFYDNNKITKTYGSYEQNFKFANSCYDSINVNGDLLTYTNNGFTTSIDEEKTLTDNRNTLNNSNISQSIITKLNNNNEFTFVFLTNNTGYINNYLKIGNFQKNIYGKIVILEQNQLPLTYNVNIDNQDNTSYYDTLLHIVLYKNNSLKYYVYSNTTLLAYLDETNVNINNIDLSIMNIVNYKKTYNNTLYSDSSISNPTMNDIKYYCNTVNLGTPTNGTLYNINYNNYKKRFSLPVEFGVYSTFPTDKLAIYDIQPILVYELQIPSDCSSCKISYQTFDESEIYIYDGKYLDNIDLTVNFDGYVDNSDLSPIYVSNKQSQQITIMIRNKYYRTLDIDNTFYLKIEYNGITYTDTTELPLPKGKLQQIEDVGLNKHKYNNDYIYTGKYHLYNHYLPVQYLEKIKQLYFNNIINNTAIFLD